MELWDEMLGAWAWPSHAAAGVGGGRHLHNNVTDSWAFKYIIIAFACTFGALAIGSAALALFCCWRSKAKVQPYESELEAGRLPQAQYGDQAQQGDQNIKPAVQPQAKPAGAWDAQGDQDIQRYDQNRPQQQPQLPTIWLSPVIPIDFKPYVSNPRPPGTAQYERLLLLSSRVHEPMKLAAAALPNVAVVVYDWKNFTLQELVRYMKRALGINKVISVAVAAPGDRPGCVSLLDDAETTTAALGQRRDLLQFWRVLAGCVAPLPAGSVADAQNGRRVDLLGCRVVESPKDGAALLRDLWARTSVPFAAADVALGGYQLATFLEEPATNSLSLVSSSIPAIDLYFNKDALQGIQPPPTTAPSVRPVAAVPAAVPAASPAAAVQQMGFQPGTTPQQGLTTWQQGYPPGFIPSGPTSAAASPAPAPAPAPQGDIFERFTAAVAAQPGATPASVFQQYDRDKKGAMSIAEVTNMARGVVPSATSRDLEHFQAMLDLDGSNEITQGDFVKTLDRDKAIHQQVRQLRDDDGLMEILQVYLTDHEPILKEYFRKADKDQSGRLDHSELAAFLLRIADLTPDERKTIMTFLYEYAPTADGQLSFDELKTTVAGIQAQIEAKSKGQPIPPMVGSVAAAAAGPQQQQPAGYGQQQAYAQPQAYAQQQPMAAPQQQQAYAQQAPAQAYAQPQQMYAQPTPAPQQQQAYAQAPAQAYAQPQQAVAQPTPPPLQQAYPQQAPAQAYAQPQQAYAQPSAAPQQAPAQAYAQPPPTQAPPQQQGYPQQAPAQTQQAYQPQAAQALPQTYAQPQQTYPPPQEPLQSQAPAPQPQASSAAGYALPASQQQQQWEAPVASTPAPNPMAPIPIQYSLSAAPASTSAPPPASAPAPNPMAPVPIQYSSSAAPANPTPAPIASTPAPNPMAPVPIQNTSSAAPANPTAAPVNPSPAGPSLLPANPAAAYTSVSAPTNPIPAPLNANSVVPSTSNPTLPAASTPAAPVASNPPVPSTSNLGAPTNPVPAPLNPNLAAPANPNPAPSSAAPPPQPRPSEIEPSGPSMPLVAQRPYG